MVGRYFGISLGSESAPFDCHSGGEYKNCETRFDKMASSNQGGNGDNEEDQKVDDLGRSSEQSEAKPGPLQLFGNMVESLPGEGPVDDKRVQSIIRVLTAGNLFDEEQEKLVMPCMEVLIERAVGGDQIEVGAL